MGPGPESHPVPKTYRRRTGVRTMQGMNCLPSGPMLLDQDGLNIKICISILNIKYYLLTTK